MTAWIRLPNREVPPAGTIRLVRKFLFLPDYAQRSDGRYEWRWLGVQSLRQCSDGNRWWNQVWMDEISPRELAKRINRGEKRKVLDDEAKA